MARTVNIKAYESARNNLLAIGVELVRKKSFSGIGITDILNSAGIPKGSFYHYFKSKEDFGLQLMEHYHAQQMELARRIMHDEALTPIERLRHFFNEAKKEFEHRNFQDGCLMCNLSTELADTHPTFQTLLKQQWHELTEELSICIAKIDRQQLGLHKLSNAEAASWLINSWAGALTRMKAEASVAPLALFEKSIFGHLEK